MFFLTIRIVFVSIGFHFAALFFLLTILSPPLVIKWTLWTEDSQFRHTNYALILDKPRTHTPTTLSVRPSARSPTDNWAQLKRIARSIFWLYFSFPRPRTWVFLANFIFEISFSIQGISVSLKKQIQHFWSWADHKRYHLLLIVVLPFSNLFSSPENKFLPLTHLSSFEFCCWKEKRRQLVRLPTPLTFPVDCFQLILFFSSTTRIAIGSWKLGGDLLPNAIRLFGSRANFSLFPNRKWKWIAGLLLLPTDGWTKFVLLYQIRCIQSEPRRQRQSVPSVATDFGHLLWSFCCFFVADRRRLQHHLDLNECKCFIYHTHSAYSLNDITKRRTIWLVLFADPEHQSPNLLPLFPRAATHPHSRARAHTQSDKRALQFWLNRAFLFSNSFDLLIPLLLIDYLPC